MTISTIIVDDENLSRRGIRTLLARDIDFEVMAECSNATEAIDAIRVHTPDLVFLDVRMPGSSGFDVIEAVGVANFPHVVFVTAYDEFATRAFDVHALDYVLKPINEQRFRLALNRARSAIAKMEERPDSRRLEQLLADCGRALRGSVTDLVPDRIPVKVGGRVVVIRIAEVDWVKAEHDYVSLYIGTKSWLVREPISAFEARFGNAGFVRIHRSTLVNVDRVQELRPIEKGEYTVVLRDGVQLKLSRNYRVALRRLAGALV